jgi:SAM-dependent methyltransferase
MQNLEPPYCYYAYAVSKNGAVDYMHYGYWEDDTKSIAEAQEKLAEMMKSHIPAGVGRILDSGCGLGRTTSDLSKKGFDVVGISPDRNLILMAKDKYPDVQQKFVCGCFEDYEDEKRFDMVLFQESSQYIDVCKLFHKCAELLKLSGFVLICDEVRYSSVPRLFNNRSDMLAFASINGFELVVNEVITSKVFSTRQYLTRTLRENVDQIVQLFDRPDRDVRTEVKDLISEWERDTKYFESNDYGYEVFLFKKISNSHQGLTRRLFTSRYRLSRKWQKIRSRR